MLKLNIQFFADGESDDEFDLDAIMDEFASTQTSEDDEEESGETETDTEEETEDDNDESSESSETGTETEDDDDQTSDNPPGNETPQDNGRWRELRQQAEQSQKYQEALNKIAQANGISTDDLMAQLQERQLEVEAEQNGVSIDVQRRLNTLENQNAQLERDRIASQMASDIEKLKNDYNIKDDQDPMIQNGFNYLANNGYVDPNTQLPTMRFSDAFFLANKESIAKKQADALIQKDLAEKKKRQDTSALPANNGNSETPNEVNDEEIARMVADDLKDFI